MKIRLQQYLLLCFIGMNAVLQAQIVNVEDKRIDRQDTSGWFGFADLGFNLVNNGKEVVSFRGAIRLDYVNKRHLFLTITNYTLLKASGQDFVNNGFQHFRYNYQLNDWLTWEVFTQGQRNERINLDFRGLIGTGPRFNIVEKAKTRARMGLLYMYEYEQETNPTRIFRDHRLSTYFSLNYQPSDILTLASITYFQPLITGLEDYRLSSQSSIVLSITKKLRFRTTFNITHDTRVPEGVVNTFYSLVNGVRWDF